MCLNSERESSHSYPGSTTVPIAKICEAPLLATMMSPDSSSLSVQSSLAFWEAVEALLLYSSRYFSENRTLKDSFESKLRRSPTSSQPTQMYSPARHSSQKVASLPGDILTTRARSRGSVHQYKN